MPTLTGLIKDPTPGGPTTGVPNEDNEVIFTDQWNVIVDIISGDHSSKIPETALGVISIAKITNLQTTLDGKAALSHTHLKTEISDTGTWEISEIPELPQSKITNLITDLSNKQPLDSDLTAIAGLSPTNDDIIQRKGGVWTNRNLDQLITDMALTKADITDFAHTHVKTDITNTPWGKTDLPSSTVFNDQANTYSGGGTQDFGESILTNISQILRTGTPATGGFIKMGLAHKIRWTDDASNDVIITVDSSGRFHIQEYTATLFNYVFGNASADWNSKPLVNVLYVEDDSTNPATSGSFRVGNNRSVNWRNAGNTTDLGIFVNTSDKLEISSSLLLDDTWIANHSALTTADPAADHLLILDATDGVIKKILPNNLGISGGVSDGDKGDITVSGSGTVWTIDSDVVTFTKMQNIATSRLLGRNTAGSGDIEELNAATAKTILAIVRADISDFAHASTHQLGGSDSIKLDDFATPDDNTDLDATTARHGLLPKLGGGTTNFLRADGTWAAPSGGGGGLDAATVMARISLRI
jgi:hypothetical protein